MAGWFLECDLIGLASNSIQVVSHILPTVPYTKSPKIGQTGNGPSTTGWSERASFFNRKRSSYHLTMQNWKQHNHCGSGRYARFRYRFGFFHRHQGQYKQPTSKATTKLSPNLNSNPNNLEFIWWWNCMSYYDYISYANKISCHLWKWLSQTRLFMS